jgi:hypothetical protein
MKILVRYEVEVTGPDCNGRNLYHAQKLEQRELFLVAAGEYHRAGDLRAVRRCKLRHAARLRRLGFTVPEDTCQK